MLENVTPKSRKSQKELYRHDGKVFDLLGDSLSCPLENKLSDVHEILLRLSKLPSFRNAFLISHLGEAAANLSAVT